LDLTISTDGTTYWVSDKQPLTDIKNWRKVTAANFQKLLVGAADKFPKYDLAENEKQSHVTILVHGYNQTFVKAAAFYEKLCGSLFDGPTAPGFAFYTTGHHAATSWAMRPDRSRMRAGALRDLTDV
jgi:hypothetical protein